MTAKFSGAASKSLKLASSELSNIYRFYTREVPSHLATTSVDLQIESVEGSESIPRCLELGCGNEKPEGFYGVDIADTEAADKVQDLDEENWDLPENHFDVVRCVDVFEHLENPVQFMENLHTVCRDGAKVVIQAPHFSSMNWHDPTHKRMVGSRTFDNFTGEGRFTYYTDKEFELKSKEIIFSWTKLPVYKRVGYFLANNFTQFYESSFLKNLFPATNIRFELEVVKQ